jgi:hypothetical protein
MNKHTVSNKGTDFDYTIQNIRRLYSQAITSGSLSHTKKIHLEDLWTDALLQLLKAGNVDVLKSFRYWLEMDEENDHEERSPK